MQFFFFGGGGGGVGRVNKVYYGRCAKGQLNKKYGRYLSVQKQISLLYFN